MELFACLEALTASHSKGPLLRDRIACLLNDLSPTVDPKDICRKIHDLYKRGRGNLSHGSPDFWRNVEGTFSIPETCSKSWQDIVLLHEVARVSLVAFLSLTMTDLKNYSLTTRKKLDEWWKDNQPGISPDLLEKPYLYINPTEYMM